MKILILDTETIDLQKRFCYNLGYIVYDTVEKKPIKSNDFVVEQVWHNIALFETAYYAEKKQIYISNLRTRKSKLIKWGFLMQKLKHIMDFYEIEYVYAFNSVFDDGVISYNCNWFKTLNPFDNRIFIDIRGYVHNKISFTKEYQEFCEKNGLFTEAGNYSTTAEAVYRFIKNDPNFIEEHTALSDCEIELEILLYCIKRGCDFNKCYTVYRNIKREKPLKDLKIIDMEKNEHIFKFREKRETKKNHTITLK